MKKFHLYHILDENQWPVLASWVSFNFILGTIVFMNYGKGLCFLFNLGLVLLSMYGWFRDISREGDLAGEHTLVVKRGLVMGFLLFLISEIMIFATLFTSFFYFSLMPSFAIGVYWPPVNILGVSPAGLPLLNTVILLTSGFTVTTSHIYLKAKKPRESALYLMVTILLGLLFFTLQIVEYLNANVNITDSIYGSLFYGITGLHGFHVFVGIILLAVCYFRLVMGYFNRAEHISYEFAIWYWHFVDIVWIFVILFIYIWSYIF